MGGGVRVCGVCVCEVCVWGCVCLSLNLSFIFAPIVTKFGHPTKVSIKYTENTLYKTDNNILRSNVEKNEFIHINRLALFGFRGLLYAKQFYDRRYAQ